MRTKLLLSAAVLVALITSVSAATLKQENALTACVVGQAAVLLSTNPNKDTDAIQAMAFKRCKHIKVVNGSEAMGDGIYWTIHRMVGDRQ